MPLYETIPIARNYTSSAIQREPVCPVCSREARGEFVPLSTLGGDLADLIRANAPDKRDVEAACARCVTLFGRAKEQIIADAAVSKDGSHVLSTPLRLDADDRFTGRGVT